MGALAMFVAGGDVWRSSRTLVLGTALSSSSYSRSSVAARPFLSSGYEEPLSSQEAPDTVRIELLPLSIICMGAEI